MKKLWIAWEDDTSIRSRVLARELGADFRAFTRFDGSQFLGWLRYPVAAIQTLIALLNMRRGLLVVQNPSILLAFEAALLRPLIGYQLVIDLHTPFIKPTGLKKRIATLLHEYGLRHCDVVVVTNDAFRRRVARQTRKPVLVLPDKVPAVQEGATRVPLEGAMNILYICTFSDDEPWREVIAAGSRLPGDVCIHISGRSPLRDTDVPANVTLTGYLPRADYQNLLCSVDAVMVLTTAEENLVCGGYEAVAAGKPLILSNTAALSEFFRRGTVFTDNREESIAGSIEGLRGRLRDLEAGIEMQRIEMDADWQRRWAVLLEHLEAGHAGTSERYAGASAS